jgi:hypothetical protein
VLLVPEILQGQPLLEILYNFYWNITTRHTVRSLFQSYCQDTLVASVETYQQYIMFLVPEILSGQPLLEFLSASIEHNIMLLVPEIL